MKIEITTTSDEYECETCGFDWAEGGYVHVDGELVLEKEAVAHCFGGASYTESELLVLALEKLGHTITVDKQAFHINQADAREEA